MTWPPPIEVGSHVMPVTPRLHFDRDSVTTSQETGRVKRIEGDRVLVQMKSRQLKWYPRSGLQLAIYPARDKVEWRQQLDRARTRGDMWNLIGQMKAEPGRLRELYETMTEIVDDHVNEGLSEEDAVKAVVASIRGKYFVWDGQHR